MSALLEAAYRWVQIETAGADIRRDQETQDLYAVAEILARRKFKKLLEMEVGEEIKHNKLEEQIAHSVHELFNGGHHV